MPSRQTVGFILNLRSFVGSSASTNVHVETRRQSELKRFLRKSTVGFEPRIDRFVRRFARCRKRLDSVVTSRRTK